MTTIDATGPLDGLDGPPDALAEPTAPPPVVLIGPAMQPSRVSKMSKVSGRGGLGGGSVAIPFDPLLHCGARTKQYESIGGTQQRKLCKHLKGEQTEHPGDGRCWLHGGASAGRPLITGRRSKTLRFNLQEEIARAVTSPELLSLDRETALLKVMLERQMSQYESAVARYDQWLDDVDAWQAAGGDESGKVRPSMPPVPEIDLEVVKSVASLVTAGYNMRFSKRFSMPYSEVAALMTQIGALFADVCDQFQLPPEVKVVFGQRFQSEIRTRQEFVPYGQPSSGDLQLDRAGFGPPPSQQMIEGGYEDDDTYSTDSTDST